MERNFLSAAYFSLGAFALVSQTILLREFFVVVYGNELVFGVLLTNWLIGVFLGALIGGTAARRDKNNLLLFALSLMLTVVLFPAAVTAVRFLYTISGTAAGTYVNFFKVFIYSSLFIIPISFFIGFSFPIAARIQTFRSTFARDPVRKITSIYIVEAAGSLLAGIVYTFLLVGRMNPYSIAALAALPLLFSLAALLRRTPHTLLRLLTVLLFVGNVFVLTPFGGGKLEDFTAAKRWQSVSQLPLTYSVDSRYQNITVASLFNQYNLYLNTMPAAVFPNDEDNMLLAAHLICQHQPSSPRAALRILFIGDAVSGPAKFLLQYKIGKITSVEIDPQVPKTILKFLTADEKRLLSNDKRFQLVFEDGRKYVKDLARQNVSQTTPTRYDIVYLNVPEPATLLLNRFYTREFFQDLSKIIAPRGVVALNVTSSENYGLGMVARYTASVYNTVKSVFPYIVAAPGTHNFIFASTDPHSVSDDPRVLEERYIGTEKEPRRLGLIFYSLYPPEKTAAAKEAFNRNRDQRINTDDTPIAGFYYNKIVGWYGKSGVSDILEFFETLKLPYLVALILLLFLLRIFVVVFRKDTSPAARRRRLRFHTLPAVFSAGMAGMVLELVILYTFQNHFGDIYSIVGLIIALFMAGLPFGAFTASALLKRIDNKHQKDSTPSVIQVLIRVLVVIAAIALLFPYIPVLFGAYRFFNQLIIFTAAILIGFAVGHVFPLAIRLYLGKGEDTGKTAGIIDAADHIGAAAGALFIGTLLLPVIGVETVCRFLALFPFLSALLLGVDYFVSRSRQEQTAPHNL